MKTSSVAPLLVLIIFGCLMCMSFSPSAADPIKPEKEFTVPGAGHVTSLSVSESGEVIAIGRTDGTSVLLDRQGKTLKSWPAPERSWVNVIAVNSRLGLVVTGYGGGSDEVSIRQTRDYSVTSTQELGYIPSAVAFHPKEPIILLGTMVLNGKEGLVRSYNFDKKQWNEILDTKKIPDVDIRDPGVAGLKFSPDGTQLAVLARSTLLVMDWKSQKIVRAISLPGSQLFQSLHFSSDGKRLVLSDQGHTFWIYDTTTWVGTEVRPPKIGGRFCLTRDDKYLCAAIDTTTGGEKGRWAINSFPDLKPLAEVVGHDSPITQIVADPKENKILTGGADGKILRWSVEQILKPR